MSRATDLKPVKEVTCYVHTDRELEFYCKTCDELICSRCALKSGKHQSHDYEELSKVYGKFKAEITSSLGPVEEQLKTTDRALAQLDVRCGEISDQRASIETDIHNTSERLHEMLNVKKTMLISKLHQITQAKLKVLAIQRDKLETTQAELRNSLDLMRESLLTSSHGALLTMKTIVLKRMEKLMSTIILPKPDAEADMIFSPPDMTALPECGQVSISVP